MNNWTTTTYTNTQVGEKKLLETEHIKLKNINLLSSMDEFKDDIYVKVRSTGKLLKSRVLIDQENALVTLHDKDFGISPGQACVFYKHNNQGYKVLGGGWIN